MEKAKAFFAAVAAFSRGALARYKDARHAYMRFVEAHPGKAVTIQTVTFVLAIIGAFRVVRWFV